MAEVTEKWRSERLTAALYDAGVQHDSVARFLRSTVAVSKTGGLMGDHVVGAHTDLHSDQDARRGEHPGRSRVISLSRFMTLPDRSSRSRIWLALRRFRGLSVLAPQFARLRADPAMSRSRFVAAAHTVQDRSDMLQLTEASGGPRAVRVAGRGGRPDRSRRYEGRCRARHAPARIGLSPAPQGSSRMIKEIPTDLQYFPIARDQRSHYLRTGTVAPNPVANPKSASITSLADSAGPTARNGSGDLSKTERVDLMAKSASEDQVSVR
jgi:hypothetical protein